MLPTEIQIDALLRAFSPEVIARGRTVLAAKSVGSFAAKETSEKIELEAKVRSSDSKIVYRTNVTVSATKKAKIVSTCTCPVVLNCKHGAAVLLHWQQRISGNEPEPEPEPAHLTEALSDWLGKAGKRELQLKKQAEKPKNGTDADPLRFVAWVLGQDWQQGWCLIGKKATRLKSRPSSIPRFTALDRNAALSLDPPAYFNEADIALIQRHPSILINYYGGGQKLVGGEGAALLQHVATLGRLWLGDDGTVPFAWASPVVGTFDWHHNGTDDRHELRLKIEGGDVTSTTDVLPLVPWLWIDRDNKRICPITLPVSEIDAGLLLDLPPVPKASVELLAESLPLYLRDALPALPSARPVETISPRMRPIIRLETRRLLVSQSQVPKSFLPPGRRQSWHPVAYDAPVVQISFDYGGTELAPDAKGTPAISSTAQSITRILRDTTEERRRLGEVMWQQRVDVTLHGLSLAASGRPMGNDRRLDESGTYAMTSDLSVDTLRLHLRALLPRLARTGWRLDIEDASLINLVHLEFDGDALTLQANANGQNTDSSSKDGKKDDQHNSIDWFDIEAPVNVAGQPLDLVPALIAWLRDMKHAERHAVVADLAHRRVPQQSDSAHNDTDNSDADNLILPLVDGRLASIPMHRLHQVLDSLLTLFSPREIDEGTTRISAYRADELMELEILAREQASWRGAGGKARRLAAAMSAYRTGPRRALPQGLKASLRPYQHDGFGWIGMLQAAGIGGCLADDMGLGKTVQTLAHLVAMTENASDETGSKHRPALIVAPTSVVPNWEAEAARFAPSLKVLNLTGPNRRQYEGDIDKADIVLSSYPLLSRDEDWLAPSSRIFSILVLDEAQNIRNASTAAAKAARAIKADCRLALSGTPVENHLGDIWSMMRILNPGLLGDQTQFGKDFRKPIEKEGDAAAAARLSRRLQSFLLRRTKAEVAADLPDVTHINHLVPLSPAQADIYEAVRVTMQSKVIEALSIRGLAKASIHILDALLRLRQACCDPRLLASTQINAAKQATQQDSAKLNKLVELLSELKNEGRRALVFSQFTSMLDLIEPALRDGELSFLRLDGNTQDRSAPVKAFQAGQADVFLISLKAGGAGLNLTAADTVVLYDPWWNPAVEAQAIGRAHRIGQERPVFIHRLIAESTIEEKILTLQSRKQALADVLWNTDETLDQEGPANSAPTPASKAFSSLSEADIRALFE